MVDVFISYSRADEQAVRRLAEKIEGAGYAVWWDAELPPHKSYGEVIEEKVAKAKAAVVVWSPSAAASEWVRAEADMARNQKKLIQTALGDVMPPLPFNQIQFANIGDWKGEDDHPGWRKVMASLSELCGEGELAAAAAAGAAPAARMTAPPPASPPPQPTPAPATAGPPPGSLEYHRSKPGSTPKWPIFAGLGVGALGLMGGAAMLAGSGGDDSGEDFGEGDYDQVTLADPTGIEAAPLPESTLAPAPAPTETAAPAPAPAPTQAAAPSYPRGPQSFSGALNVGQSRSYTVGLNAGTSYMIVGECDLDCSDIDMWLYDENGTLIDEDTLDDDVPVLEVTPVRSAEFQMRIQMFTCTVEPCGVQISVQPM